MRMTPRLPVRHVVAWTLAAASALAQSGSSPATVSWSNVLPQFTAPSVPALGPKEVVTEKKWPLPAALPARPGKGLAQHPMLYAGESHNVLFLVNDGKVIWTYQNGPGGEIDDLWLMSNGHILYTRQFSVEEVTPDKKIVWHYAAPAGTEVHSAQPIGLDKVTILQNGAPPKILVLNKQSGATELELTIPGGDLSQPRAVHTQFRRLRVTAAGTFLVSYLRLNRVVEFDRTGKEIWSYEVKTPWAATRLRNGNTLIVNEGDRFVREVNPKKETVWEFSQADLPRDLPLRNMQSAERLANGNTVIFSSGFGVKPPDWPNYLQCVEVTPDKKVVWALQDWQHLGPATTAQFLDQPGVPEIPGSVER